MEQRKLKTINYFKAFAVAPSDAKAPAKKAAAK